jgi:WD repeat-containing protein 48
MQLKGHTDNIRALQLDAEGRLLLTGSADHTMRLWDLGQQRCVQTLAVHTDSVWALAAGAGFSTVYSGGRDGCIYKTRLATRVSELLACEQQPVLRLAVAADETSLWAASTSPSVHKWQVEAREPPVLALPVSPRSPGPAGGGAGPIAGSFFHASPSVAARARLAFDLHGTRPSSQQLQPAAATPGIPPIQHAAVLTDRRHVLTLDAEGRVQMWDVTAGAVVRDFGQRELKDIERQLFEPSHSVSAWFAPEVKLGSLSGSMEAPGCFGAEIYAQDLGDAEAPIDLKVNFGEQMLVALFRQWASVQQQQQQQQQAAIAGPSSGAQQQRQPAAAPAAAGGPSPAAGAAAAGAAVAAAAEAGGRNDGAQQQQVDEDSSMADADEDAAAGSGEPAAPSSRFVFEGPLAPVVMVAPVGGSSTGGAGSIPWRCAIDSFSGEEEVPQWVADCVLHGHFPVSRELKMAFQLLPLPGSGLPSLLQSRLNAPRVLRVNKVADYVKRKMEEHGIQLREEPLFWDPAKAERWQAEASAAQQDPGTAAGVHQLQPVAGGAGGGAAQPAAILITCKGHTVPWDFSLAAVRQWIWRRSDDLVLHYSVRDERTPLRLPAIRPPS